jgi:hypothetical protein
MSIINKDDFVHIMSWGLKNDHHPIRIRQIKDQGHHHLYFKLHNWSNDNYWYVEFLHGDAFYWHPISTLTDSDTFKKIQNGEVKLILCNNQEAYHSIVDEIYEYVVIRDNIPAENIILLTNSFDIVKEIDFVSHKYNQNKIKVIYMCEFLLTARNYAIHNLPTLLESHNSKKTYTKKFISFNGFDRPHRVGFVNLLNIHNLLQFGHVSYNTNMNGNVHFSGTEYFRRMKNNFRPDSKLIQDIINNEDKVTSLGPIWLDSTLKTARNQSGYIENKTDYYVNTYFSVVTETLCMLRHSADGHLGIGRALSEKTFKPVLCLHPFILLAVPKSLELFKYLGFQSFHPYINESYDDITDDSDRIYAVFEETRRLCNLTPDETNEFINFCMPICMHNFKTLLKYKDFSINLN